MDMIADTPVSELHPTLDWYAQRGRHINDEQRIDDLRRLRTVPKKSVSTKWRGWLRLRTG
ncbi:hypothetical protein VSR73_08900 [Paraburkholderia ferrariae]|uniref:Uncharacterized protein n=2 Tax=Paraburkholderia ferrariae TaxID=386056 RepID=A0ABU9RNC4_9BURK